MDSTNESLARCLVFIVLGTGWDSDSSIFCPDQETLDSFPPQEDGWQVTRLSLFNPSLPLGCSKVMCKFWNSSPRVFKMSLVSFHGFKWYYELVEVVLHSRQAMVALRQSHTFKAHDHVKIFKFSAKVNLLNRHREMSRWYWVVGLKPAVLQSEKSHLKLLNPCGCYTLFFSEWLVCLSRSHVSNRLQINFGC